MSYATPQQLLQFRDARLIGDLVEDTGSPIDAESLLQHPVVELALSTFSGRIDAGIAVGGQYTPTDLAALTGDAANFLASVCCAGAIVVLMERRQDMSADQVKAARENADYYLDKLRKGENVFAIPSRPEAALIDTAGPTVVDFRDMNLIRERTQNYYPVRQQPRFVR